MNHAAWRFAKENDIKRLVLGKDDGISTITDIVRGFTNRQLLDALFSVVDWDLHSVDPTWEDGYLYSDINLHMAMLALESVSPDWARRAYLIYSLQGEYVRRFGRMTEPTIDHDPTPEEWSDAWTERFVAQSMASSEANDCIS